MSILPVQRKIIHIDMDAFFAAVEQQHNPEYKGKAIVVGSADSRGVVAAASYEARKFGVYSAMSSAMAKQKCPHLIFVSSNFALYREISQQIRKIFYEYTDLVEPLSLDEAYLDVTTNFANQASASIIAQEIRQRIVDATQLTASADVSYNKFLAKIASDVNKPNGIKVIIPQDAEAFMDALAIEKFYGVGKVTAKKFIAAGIRCGKDLKQCSLEWLQENFGKSGHYYYQVVRGIDERPVNPNRIRKSIGVENTFAYNLSSKPDLHTKLEVLAEELWVRCRRLNKFGIGLTLKVKLDSFQLITRSITVSRPLNSADTILILAKNLIDTLILEKNTNLSVRLLGLSIYHLNQADNLNQQYELNFAI